MIVAISSASVQVGAWSVAIVGGLVAAFKAIAEMHDGNTQRSEDMRWKRAEMARACLNDLHSNQLATSALKMLDWDNLCYDKPAGGATSSISHEARRKALRTMGTIFSVDSDERFIRDCFDELLDSLQMLEHFIRIRLIVFEDVELPLSYYVVKLSSPAEYPVIMNFMSAYGYQNASSFLGRFPTWPTSD